MLYDDIIIELAKHIAKSDWHAFLFVSKQFYICGLANGIYPTLENMKYLIDCNHTVEYIKYMNNTFRFTKKNWAYLFIYTYCQYRRDITQYISENMLHDDDICTINAYRLNIKWNIDGLTPVIDVLWNTLNTKNVQESYCDLCEKGFNDWGYTSTEINGTHYTSISIAPDDIAYNNTYPTVEKILELTKDFPGYRTMLCESRGKALHFALCGGKRTNF